MTEHQPPSLWLTPQGTLRFWPLCTASLVIASLYLATVSTNFDFLDDGVTAHPQGVASFADFHSRVWRTTYGEFVHKGPYRPVAWYFWIGQQEYCGNAIGWRCVRFLWTLLSVAVFIWFLQEMGFSAGVSLLTTTLAMWNPYRAEVWLSPTLCEGIALPFALTGLACAYRAARSDRAWLWDLGAIACAIAAVGCKNVFVAVIPAQMFLRVCHPELSLWDGIKRNGWRAAVLGSVMILPVAHFVCYRLTMHADRLDMVWDPWQPLRLLRAFSGAMGKDFLGPAFVSAMALCGWAWLRGWAPAATEPERMRFRAVFGAGLILFLLGWGVYAPMNGAVGRYTFPGIWGLDLLSALLWAKLWTLVSPWQKLTYALAACGVLITALALAGKQEKNTARITTLWDALYCVEISAPAGARVAWVGVQDRLKAEELEIGEGIHFRWHLEGRGRRDLTWEDIIPGKPLATAGVEPAIVVTSSPTPPIASGSSWTLLKESRQRYWFGRKEVVCCVWQRTDTLTTNAPTGSSLSSRQGRSR